LYKPLFVVQYYVEKKSHRKWKSVQDLLTIVKRWCLNDYWTLKWELTFTTKIETNKLLQSFILHLFPLLITLLWLIFEINTVYGLILFDNKGHTLTRY